jgi:hypothetical protein
MLIEIPCSLTFDCTPDGTQRNHGSNARLFTLRYDTDPSVQVAAEYTDHYPPRPNAHWIADEQGLFFDLFTSRADRTIRERAEDDPESYKAKVTAP